MEEHKLELLGKHIHDGMHSDDFEDQLIEIDQADQEVNKFFKCHSI